MAAIDNLGAYGELTMAAKAAGGVEQLIGRFENEAVAKAAPGLRVQGGLIGVGVSAIGVGIWWLYSQRRRSHTDRLERVRSELREALDGPSPHEADLEGESPKSATSPA